MAPLDGGQGTAQPSGVKNMTIPVDDGTSGYFLSSRVADRLSELHFNKGLGEALASGVTQLRDVVFDIQKIERFIPERLARQLLDSVDIAISSAEAVHDDESRVHAVDLLRSASGELSIVVDIGRIIDLARRTGERAEQSLYDFESRVKNAEVEWKRMVTTEYDTALSEFHEQTDRLLSEVTSRGSESVARVKKEIVDVLLDDAQCELQRAQNGFRRQIGTWAVLSVIVITAFFAFAFRIVAEQHLPSAWTWQIAYYTGIRGLILGAMGAIAGFCLRMLKAHINLAHVNAHRARVANSMPGFLEAAPKEHRFEMLNGFEGFERFAPYALGG